MEMQIEATARAKGGKKLAAGADKMRKLGGLIRRYFRDKYNDNKVRDGIAKDYGVCRRTAGLWMSTGPTSRHLVRIIAKEGMAFVAACIHPIATVKDLHDRRLDARQAAIDAQLAAEQDDFAADLASGGAGRGSLAGRRVSVIGALKARLRRETV